MPIRLDALTLEPRVAGALDLRAVPGELRQLDQWVVWKQIEREGKPTKCPFDTKSGKLAKANDSSTWSSFAAAYAALRRAPRKWAGLGFVFAEGGGLVGVDLDGCVDPETSTLLAWPQDFRKLCSGNVPEPVEIVKRLATYGEISPSGCGVKLFGRGTLPAAGNRRGSKAAGIELYDRGRFFCVTGQLWPGAPSRLTDCNGELSALHEAIFGNGHGQPQADATAADATGDDAIIRLASTAANGEKFRRLWSGDVRGYPSPSEGDLALADLLSFWTGPDVGRIKRLLEQSGLAREKWKSYPDYLTRTIEKALAGRTEFFGDAKPPVSTTAPKKSPAVEVKGQDAMGAPPISNVMRKGKGENARTIPLPMQEIIGDIRKRTSDWPRQVEHALFVDQDGEIQWIKTSSALFGWLATRAGNADWRRANGAVTKDELFSELSRTMTAYEAIESAPHWPPIPEHYYTCPIPAPGDGKTLNALFDFFRPETDLDRQLLQAAIITPIWGGLPGMRPAMMLTASTGRGKGKTVLCERVAQLYGGSIDISPQEDVSQIKARLLTPESASCRVALLDNVKTQRFSWGDLEALITCTAVSGRRLYVGDAHRPNYFCWFITLNGASLSTDMAQRVVEIRLAEPDYSGGWEEAVKDFIENHRAEIFADAVGFLQRPEKPLRRYSRWATWEKAVLSRLNDPDAALDLILERRGQVDVEKEEGEIISDYFAGRLKTLAYDPDRDDVFIPNDLAADWYGRATGERVKVAGACRAIRQLHDEGRLPHILSYRVGTAGRGFRWCGEHADANISTLYDIKKRLAKQEEQGRF